MTTPESFPAHSGAASGSHDIPSRIAGSHADAQFTAADALAASTRVVATSPSMPPGAFAAPPLATRRRSVGVIVTIVLLALALMAAIAFLVIYLNELRDANSLIDEQKQKIEEQQEFIDKKETFGAAMEHLLDTASAFEEVPFATIVPTQSYELAASRAWTHRWDLEELDDDIENVNESVAELEALIEAAALESTSNSTGSQYESTIDSLGLGYVSSLLYDADTFCTSDVLACVSDDDPYVVHFDLADNNVVYTNDFIRTGIAYHEFAHVLQFTNPEPTEVALEAFGGDYETMADCFALTYLAGWTLDHRVYISSYSWWDVSIGYGYTCNDSQKQVVRDWYTQLGYTSSPISQ